LVITILCVPAFSVKQKKGKTENKTAESTGLQKARFLGGRWPSQAQTITKKQARNTVTDKRTVLLHQLEQRGSLSELVRCLDSVFVYVKKTAAFSHFFPSAKRIF
jgi:hypothetical protein